MVENADLKIPKGQIEETSPVVDGFNFAEALEGFLQSYQVYQVLESQGQGLKFRDGLLSIGCKIPYVCKGEKNRKSWLEIREALQDEMKALFQDVKQDLKGVEGVTPASLGLAVRMAVEGLWLRYVYGCDNEESFREACWLSMRGTASKRRLSEYDCQTHGREKHVGKLIPLPYEPFAKNNIH